MKEFMKLIQTFISRYFYFYAFQITILPSTPLAGKCKHIFQCLEIARHLLLNLRTSLAEPS